MKHLDITIDLESLALSTNAAILQIAAIAWDRNNPDHPFVDHAPFVGYVDIRSCVRDNFDFEPRTIKWWGSQKEDIKEAVLTPPSHPLKDVLESLVQWVDELKETTQADTVCLWAQGSDFDIANLRNAFARYDLTFPFNHNFFRDARTFILEVGAYTLMSDDPLSGIADVKQIYSNIPKCSDTTHDVHNAVSDAQQTTWNVWQLLKRLQNVSKMGRGLA